jgi:ABC-type sugar transport system ATPase subunit
LKIFKYPNIQLSDLDRYKLKTLVVLGETGCGKSTFLNSLVNFLAGVEVEDPFRYFIVI